MHGSWSGYLDLRDMVCGEVCGDLDDACWDRCDECVYICTEDNPLKSLRECVENCVNP